MSRWPVIVGMAVVTYALRALPMIVGWGRAEDGLERSLRYVPPALFAALIVPSVLAPAGTLQVGLRLWAGLAGLAVGWRTRSIPLTVIAGLGAFAILRWLTGG